MAFLHQHSSGIHRYVDLSSSPLWYGSHVLVLFPESLVIIGVIAPFCLLIWRQSGAAPRAILGPTAESTRDAIQAVVNKLQVGFYGNVLVLLAVVWEQHQSTSFVVLTRIFLFVSHIQVFRGK